MPFNEITDADQASRNEWVECPKCRSVMLPLRDYDIQTASEFPGVGAELWEFLVFGWIVFVYNFAVGLLGFGGQKARLAKQKKDFLPAFPNSLNLPALLLCSETLVIDFGDDHQKKEKPMNTRITLSAALAASALFALAPAQAQAPSTGSNIETLRLETKIEVMQQQINALQSQVKQLQAQLRASSPSAAVSPVYPSLNLRMPNSQTPLVAPQPHSRDNSIPDYTATFIKHTAR